MTNIDFSENTLVEQPAISLFGELKYETANCYHETFGQAGTLGRQTTADVILVPRLRAALENLNPDLPSQAITLAIEELGKDRSAMSPAQANREVYKLLKNGIKVPIQTGDEEDYVDVTVIDWKNPTNNDFFLASQFWVSGDIYKRRADLIGFVNGLPLIFIELKKSHGKLENAYKHNLKDYKNTIPHLFWYNAFIILSNGSEAKIGSITAGWEHFADWKRINDEGEQGIVSLETMIRGTCEKNRLFDIIENFIVFEEAQGGLIKLVAKNHQYLGVNRAIEALKKIKNNQGKLGVFWHTQGSGKSFSMVFFSQKVHRKIPGNWTFLVITDRDDLDDQISKNFKNTGAVTEEHIQAESGEHLKQLLTEDHRQIFTLIQKFHTAKGDKYKKLSDRSDIIVIADEAHRSQYDTFALNMRNALPNAAFIAFTGTPLMAGEEKTKDVFGDYISIYNFRQSIEDGATVPLFYENRIPELQLTNDNLKEDLEDLIESADLNEEQQKKLERTFAREYHLITRDDRLEKVADDLVSHFMGRGNTSDKAMVICIDRFTAVKMYDKVRKYWKKYIEDFKQKLNICSKLERLDLDAKIKLMEETDMAVVISSAQNEVDDFKNKGLDIETHRKRMAKEDLETKFKTSKDAFRIVFVCAMWITGFDAPCVSTIYLDKPMRNHSLMQTIARANRVFGEKNNGLIVDYVGVFRNLQKALAIYGSGSGGGVKPGETPVQDKGELIKALQVAIDDTRQFCKERGVALEPIVNSEGFKKVAYLEDAATQLVDKKVLDAVDDALEKVIVNDDLKKKYILLANDVVRLYKAILPDPDANEFAPIKTCIAVLAEKIKSYLPEVSIEEVMAGVERILDDSISPTGYEIKPSDENSLIDLGKIDFDALKEHFKIGRKRTEAEKLKRLISGKLQCMVMLNKSRMDYLEKFKELIDDYNSGLDVGIFFDRLLAFYEKLDEEEQRGVAEQLSEEELAVFDILTKPEINMTPAEKETVKKAARNLLQSLKQGKLVLDWKKKQQARADVLRTVEMVLDEALPRVYTPELFKAKCDLIYQHVYDSYYGEEQSVYAGVV